MTSFNYTAAINAANNLSSLSNQLDDPILSLENEKTKVQQNNEEENVNTSITKLTEIISTLKTLKTRLNSASADIVSAANRIKQQEEEAERLRLEMQRKKLEEANEV